MDIGSQSLPSSVLIEGQVHIARHSVLDTESSSFLPRPQAGEGWGEGAFYSLSLEGKLERG